MTPNRALLPGLLLAAIVACGGGDDAPAAVGQEDSIRNVTPSNLVFTLEDFSAIGFKVAKEYNVEGLAAATGAWFGFWPPGGVERKRV